MKGSFRNSCDVLLHCTNSILVPPVINFMVLLLARLPAIGTKHKCLVAKTLVYFVQQLALARESSTFIMAKKSYFVMYWCENLFS